MNYLTAKMMCLIPWESGVLQIHLFTHVSRINIVSCLRKLVECPKIVKAVSCVSDQSEITLLTQQVIRVLKICWILFLFLFTSALAG